MKPILRILLATVLLLTGIPAFADGAVSGGGGGSLPENPAGPEVIESILREGRGELLMYFQSKDIEGSELNSKLYTSTPNIYDIIRKTEFGIKRDAPCIGLDGKEYDGSVVGPTKDSLCISVKNLGTKLTPDNAHRQTIALLAHEYSHLLGFDETEAQQLQKWIVTDYQNNVPQRVQGFYADYVTKWEGELAFPHSALTTILMVAGQVTHPSDQPLPELYYWDSICNLSRRWKREFLDLRFINPTLGHFLPFKRRDFDQHLIAIAAKSLGLRVSACGLQEHVNQHNGDEETFHDYISAFGDEQIISTETFVKNYHHITLVGESGFSIRRIQIKRDSVQETTDLLAYIGRIRRVLDEVKTPAALISF